MCALCGSASYLWRQWVRTGVSTSTVPAEILWANYYADLNGCYSLAIASPRNQHTSPVTSASDGVERGEAHGETCGPPSARRKALEETAELLKQLRLHHPDNELDCVSDYALAFAADQICAMIEKEGK